MPELHWNWSLSEFVIGLMTSSPRRRQQERKKNSLHSSVNVHLKLQLNQSLEGINRERLGRLRGWLDMWTERGRECLKMSAERQSNNWSIQKDGFCHFEKGCQQGCSLPPAQSYILLLGLWRTHLSTHLTSPNPPRHLSSKCLHKSALRWYWHKQWTHIISIGCWFA